MRAMHVLIVIFLLCSFYSFGQQDTSAQSSDTTVVFARFYQVDSQAIGRYTVRSDQGDLVYALQPSGRLIKTNVGCSGRCPDEVGSYRIGTNGGILVKVGREQATYFLYQSAGYYFLIKEEQSDHFETEALAQNQKSIETEQSFQQLVLATLARRYLSRKMP